MEAEGAALAEAMCALSGAARARGWCIPPPPPRARPRPPAESRFACPACGDVLQQPVTALCGHTCCRECTRARCPACGAIARTPSSTNVLVQQLVERWWSAELLSARAAHEAERLLTTQNDTQAALAKCEKALHFSPNNHRLLAVRAIALSSLGRYADALESVNIITKSRPTWSKGHFVKGVILSSLDQHEDSLICFFISACLGHSAQAIMKNVKSCLQRIFPIGDLKDRRKMPRKGRPTLAYYKKKISECRSLLKNKKKKNNIPQEFSENYDINNCVSPESASMNQLVDRIFKEVQKYTEMTPSATELQVESILVDQSDFECILCCRSLWKPVTTPCGHTYCCQCLERCLDYSSSCPLCMTPLTEYLANNSRNITTFIDEAMKILTPMEYNARKIIHTQEIDGGIMTDPYVPIFVCTTAFPTVPCPLHVFEPKYRLMIRRCLESCSRQFGITAITDDKATGPNRYAEFGTILEIKDCVLLSNGCSILSTVGVRRFKVLARGEKDGYDIAQIETIIDNPIEAERESSVIDLHNKVRWKAWLWFSDTEDSFKNETLRTFGPMPDEEENWREKNDGPAWIWWVLQLLPLASQLIVMILATPDLEKRLRAIERTLDYIYFMKKQTFINDSSIRLHEQPTDYFSSPWIHDNQPSSTSQLGEQSM